MASDTTTLNTLERAVDVLELLQEHDGARVTEVAEALELAPSTVHSHLKTLEKRELVTKEGDEYTLGLKFLRIGKYTQQRTEAYELADDYTRKLVEETGFRAIFMVEEHGDGVFLHQYNGEHPSWTHTSAGQRAHLHSLAAGKAILAHYPDEQVEEILAEQGLPRRTENTITSFEEYFEELEKVRENGVAFNDCENHQGIRAIGVPALGPSGQVIGSFSISGPTHTMPDEEFRDGLPQRVKGIVDEYELELTL